MLVYFTEEELKEIIKMCDEYKTKFLIPTDNVAEDIKRKVMEQINGAK